MAKTIIALLALVLAGCATDTGSDVQGPSASRPAAEDSSPAPSWLIAMSDPDPPAGSCVHQYPEDLRSRPVAVDATILSVTRGPYDEDARGTPVTIHLQVNRVFNGPPRDSLRISSWDFTTAADESSDPIGVRLLAAMEPSLDLMACGFTRPYSEGDAQRWEAAFNRSPEASPRSS